MLELPSSFSLDLDTATVGVDSSLVRSRLKDRARQQQIEKLLGSFIDSKPDAVFARTQRAILLPNAGHLTEAREDIEKALTVQGDYRWARLVKAKLLDQDKKTDEAVILINETLKQSPSTEAFIRGNQTLGHLVANPKIEWPPSE